MTAFGRLMHSRPVLGIWGHDGILRKELFGQAVQLTVLRRPDDRHLASRGEKFMICGKWKHAPDLAIYGNDLAAIFTHWDQFLRNRNVPRWAQIGTHSIVLKWMPSDMECKANWEEERADWIELEFGEQAEKAIMAWNILTQPNGLLTVHNRMTVVGEALTNVSQQPWHHPLAQESGRDAASLLAGPEMAPEFPDKETLEMSIIDAPTDWVYLLALAERHRIPNLLVASFVAARKRLKATLPSLAKLDTKLRKTNGYGELQDPTNGQLFFEPLKTTTKERLIVGRFMGLLTQKLDRWLPSNAEAANELLAMVGHIELGFPLKGEDNNSQNPEI